MFRHINENLKMTQTLKHISIKLNNTSRNIIVIVFVVFQSFLLTFNCQSQNNKSELLSLLDSTQKVYGASDILMNGPVFYESNRLAKGNPYLISSKFTKGTVFMEGKSFKDVDINYDIADQKLILIYTAPTGSRLYISMSDVLIDSFLINDYLFVNPAKLNLSSNYAYMQSLNTGRNILLIGYSKEFINRYNESEPFGKYSKSQRSLFIATDSTLNSINNNKELFKIFPSLKKEVATYLRKNKIVLKKATTSQLTQLIEFYNQQLRNTNE